MIGVQVYQQGRLMINVVRVEVVNTGPDAWHVKLVNTMKSHIPVHA